MCLSRANGDNASRAESAINDFERGQIAKWTAMDTHLFDLRVLLAYGSCIFCGLQSLRALQYFLEFAAERLALRTPAEIATDLIPDRPVICRFPGIKHFFIMKEWLETGIKPSCESSSGLI